MKNYVIQSGNFTGKSNFTGYTAKGERLFIHGAQMPANMKKVEDVKFPLFAIGAEKTITPWDADGKPETNADGSVKTVARLQAMSVFTSKDALLNAHVEDATLDIEIASAVKVKATSAGLSEAQLIAVLTASI